MKRYLLTALASSTILLFALTQLYAEASRIYTYPSDALYLSVYRFLTLDKGFTVVKENPEMGLILFSYKDSSLTDNSSSAEIIKDAQGAGNHRVRFQIPSLSEGTERLLIQELNEKIEADFSSPSMNEKIFNYPYDKLISSIYRYLTVDKDFDVLEDDFNNKKGKERGIIKFTVKSTPSTDTSSCQIFKHPGGGYKVRMAIPSMANSTLRTYLNGIESKLKSDYAKDK